MGLVTLFPEFHARPWGRRSLRPLYDQPEAVTDPIGEVWLTSLSCCAQSVGQGEKSATLEELWARMGAAERGTAMAGLERFPLLVKFIFTAQKLSVQVHPDDDYARRHAGEPWGKTEMWYVVAAEPGAWVRVGIKPGTTEEALQCAFGGPALEGLLNHISVRPGDAVYTPAGVLHAIGPGLCLCEIQQYSDLTYRVYDYNRLGLDGQKRALHIDQARAVTRLETLEAGRVRPKPGTTEGEGESWLVDCAYFAVEKFSLDKPRSLPPNSTHFDLLILCDGEGTLVAGSQSTEYAPGNAFLVTADAGPVEVRPQRRSELLRAYAKARKVPV